MEIIAEGAEAKIYKINETTLKKIRTVKPYRLPEIDFKLRKSRSRKEAKILNLLFENNVNVPQIYETSSLSKFKKKDKKEIKNYKNETEISFKFEYIKAKPLKEQLTKKLLFKAFNEIIKIHKLDISHGDLTTLNMLVKEKEVYIIDFGLSEITKKNEDKAVDLNLLFNCIKNEHPKFYKHKEELLKLYSKESENNKKIIIRLKKIEHRGRNK